MNSSKRTARLAGFLYLGLIITGVFAEFFGRSKLIVWGDAATTATNITSSELLFRFGLVSDLIMIMLYLLLGLVLYVLLKQVNKNIALLMLLLNLAGVPIMAVNMLNQFAPLLLLSGADYLSAFGEDQLNALVMFFLDLHKHGYILATISYGAYLLPLGYLVYKSDYFPGILGVLLVMASFSMLIDLFIGFLFPSYAQIISPATNLLSMIGEFSFVFWLLFKGAKIPEIE